MPKLDLHQLLDGKWDDKTRPSALFEEHVARAPAAYVADLVAGLSRPQRRVQNGCAEIASRLSEREPALLYPHADLFVRNLDSREPVLRWEAVCTLGNLAGVDSARRVFAARAKIASFLADGSIVLQGHAVRALGKVARAFPETAPEVLAALTGAAIRFPGNRVGFLVEAMEGFAGRPALVATARAFVERYLDSDIPSVAAKARRALKRLK